MKLLRAPLEGASNSKSCIEKASAVVYVVRYACMYETRNWNIDFDSYHYFQKKYVDCVEIKMSWGLSLSFPRTHHHIACLFIHSIARN